MYYSGGVPNRGRPRGDIGEHYRTSAYSAVVTQSNTSQGNACGSEHAVLVRNKSHFVMEREARPRLYSKRQVNSKQPDYCELVPQTVRHGEQLEWSESTGRRSETRPTR